MKKFITSFNFIKNKNILPKEISIINKILLIFIIFCCFTPNYTYANSSWNWISTTRPYDVLPFVVILTLAIENISIFRFSNIENKLKTFIVVLIGNLLSFAAPYIFETYVAAMGGMYSFYESLEHMPFYNISFIYLIITIIIEFPIVYNILKKHSKNKKILILTIVCSNIFTTLITYIIERIFCRGIW